ncbi:protein O-mannosyl-transferase family [Candidatus Chloroploca asiatica]|uniref:Glycosyltransferase RgtA/B/C/D-like domain-containing protein n=1 Tax=Candidatus Chloroploca asiatica TaxID=1506545 RepID=A0A2H3L2G6_9CHLR|nr:DUF2723 domain-containing protein [Candidatus Chloroploca asiatica]PDV96410.1 hypothetical protein A9Q02_06855 [Candidatus Chloroploca asiatica]
MRSFALLTFCCCAALYVLTLTDVHTYDALSYILDVERKPWQELFHPHHLAYGPLGALIHTVARGLGWPGGAERLLQLTNALAGALGVTLFGMVIGRLIGRGQSQTWAWQPALLGALLLASSFAYWYYAIEVEVYTIAAIFLIVALALMLRAARRPASPTLAAGLGLVQGVAVLFHQTNVLLSVPAGLALAYSYVKQKEAGPTDWRGLLVTLLSYGLPLALVVGGAYLWVGLGVSGFRNATDLFTWAAGYTTTGFWGGPVDQAKLSLLGQGLADTIAQPGGAILGLLLLGLLLLHLRPLRRTAPPGSLVIATSWLLVYGAFFLWWEPDNIEFWIASLPPFYLLLLLATHPASNQRDPQAPGWRHQLTQLLVLGIGVTMLGLNWATIQQRGDAQRDLQRLAATSLVDLAAPGDLLVVPDGLAELYLPFYEQHPNVISLNQAVALTGNDWPAACALIQEHIATALASGYAVFIADDAIHPPPAPPGEPPTPSERLGLAPEEVAACYAPYREALRPLELAAPLPRYGVLPGTQTLAEEPGWDFARLEWGWRVLNATTLGRDAKGWRLEPGIDPALISPPMRLDTAAFANIEITMAATTAARDAQLFWLDENGQTDEARSMRWTLIEGEEFATYRLDLAAAPGWQGIITGLRLDPVGVGDGGSIVLASIQLQR